MDARFSQDAAVAGPDVSAATPDSGPDVSYQVVEVGSLVMSGIEFGLSFPDLATNVGPDQVYIGTQSVVGCRLDLLEVYAKQIALYTWPEREPIPFQTVAYCPSAEDGRSSKVYVHFAPPTSAPRWYLIEVTPSGTLQMYQSSGTYPSSPLPKLLPSGNAQDGGIPETVGARFMTASYPRVHSVFEYLNDPGMTSVPGADWVLEIDFSETVDIRSLLPLVHLTGAAQSACTLSPFHADQSQPSTGYYIHYACTSSVLKGLSVTIDSPTILNGPTLSVPADDASLALYSGGQGEARIYYFPLTGS